jgi:hypothetical protein
MIFCLKSGPPVHDDCGALTADEKYFLSGRNERSKGEFDICSVSAGFIEARRPRE